MWLDRVSIGIVFGLCALAVAGVFAYAGRQLPKLKNWGERCDDVEWSKIVYVGYAVLAGVFLVALTYVGMHTGVWVRTQ